LRASGIAFIRAHVVEGAKELRELQNSLYKELAREQEGLALTSG
jgi:hypothetical protein